MLYSPLPLATMAFIGIERIPYLSPGWRRSQQGYQYVSEVLLIPDSDLAVLQSFNGHGSFTLSAYLRLDSPEHRESAQHEFMEQMQLQLEECGSSRDCLDALQEDMEIVTVYLRGNGARRQPGLAIFSCAAELFWRVYPLPAPLPTQVCVGPKFDLEPLKALLKQRQPS
jgi:hypothetical protein